MKINRVSLLFLSVFISLNFLTQAAQEQSAPARTDYQKQMEALLHASHPRLGAKSPAQMAFTRNVPKQIGYYLEHAITINWQPQWPRPGNCEVVDLNTHKILWNQYFTPESFYEEYSNGRMESITIPERLKASLRVAPARLRFCFEIANSPEDLKYLGHYKIGDSDDDLKHALHIDFTADEISQIKSITLIELDSAGFVKHFAVEVMHSNGTVYSQRLKWTDDRGDHF